MGEIGRAGRVATLWAMSSPSAFWGLFPWRALQESKGTGQRVAMISLHDAPSARICCEAGADALLVGDSVGNTLLGFESTVAVDVEDMRRHTGAVARGVRSSSRPDVPVVADMPFASYHGGRSDVVRSGAALMREGASGLKIEGAGESALRAARLLIEMGAPVMGHIGFTPQSSGHFQRVVQGRDEEGAKRLLEDALRLEDAGVLAIVLEAVAPAAAALVTARLGIPTIGIGAGPECDGQVLVWNDLAGLTQSPPTFARAFADARAVLSGAARSYVEAVHSKSFPSPPS